MPLLLYSLSHHLSICSLLKQLRAFCTENALRNDAPPFTPVVISVSLTFAKLAISRFHSHESCPCITYAPFRFVCRLSSYLPVSILVLSLPSWQSPSYHVEYQILPSHVRQRMFFAIWSTPRFTSTNI